MNKILSLFSCLSPPVLLAPMAGVTDPSFRQVAASFGASLVVSEMVAARQLIAREEEARLRMEGVGTEKTGAFAHAVQLVGCDPEAMAEAARMAEAAGADLIDMNMGCPSRRVTGGAAGAALMRDLPLAQKIIEAVSKAVRVPVSLKTRLGWDDASLNAAELAHIAEQSGLVFLTLHARTRQQFYKGVADWRKLAAIRAATRLPLVINGDITNLEEARLALAQSGAQGVMIGRGALGQPWHLGEIRAQLAGQAFVPTTPHARNHAILTHYNGLLRLMGPREGIRHARKHVAAYAQHAHKQGADFSPQALQNALQAEEAAPVLSFLETLYT